MEQSTEDAKTINSLPDEIISMILMNADYKDVVHFGATCKRFNNIVITDQSLWKHQYKRKLPPVIVEMVQKHMEGDWLLETKRYFTVRKQIFSEVIAMSPKFYLRKKDISLEDVRNFFALALSHNLGYYYTVTTLQEIIKQGQRNMEKKIGLKPYTLTEMHYAKVALRHLIQTFQALKWVKLHVNDELPPLIVINFFVQWIDNENLYYDDEVEDRINILVDRVGELLKINHPTKSNESVEERIAKGVIKQTQVLAAITQVLYHQPHMAVTSAANVDTLNVVKVLNNKCGNSIAVGALYDAVAKRFGVNCDLIAFPNHLFLEWRDDAAPGNKTYTIDIDTGNVRPKMQCPFSQAQGFPTKKYKYYPDPLLQYIYSAFHVTMGTIKNWHTKNALHLLDFLGTDDNVYNPYRNFLTYLLDQTHMNGNVNMNYLSSTHIQIINALSNLNPNLHVGVREPVKRRHDPSVRYAVGMVCYHRRHDFICIVRGWELQCRPEYREHLENNCLEFGPNQPCYEVIAADQSERYVAQEHLSTMNKTTRLYHLEDLIAREFTHFDGFAYVPNQEKRAEYPDDILIVDRYRNRCFV